MTDLPHFKNPPVVEAICGVLFKELTSMAGLSDIEAPGSDFDCTANQAVTEAFSVTLAEFLSAQSTEIEDEFNQGGTFTVQHRREVLFTEEMELRLQDLPRRKPRLDLDIQVAEDNGE